MFRTFKKAPNDSRFDLKGQTSSKKMASVLYFEVLSSLIKVARSTKNYLMNHLKGLSPMRCIPISILVKNTEEVRTYGK